MELFVTVRNRCAVPDPGGQQMLCGNSNIAVQFSFDAEWDALPLKTLRAVFQRNGQTVIREAVFSGDRCTMPVVSKTDLVEIGVYAGEIRTTTPARFPCADCITDIPAEEYRQQNDLFVRLSARLAHQMAEEPCYGKYLQTSSGDYIVTDTGDFLLTKE